VIKYKCFVLILFIFLLNSMIFAEIFNVEKVIFLTINNNPNLLIEKQNILSSQADVSLANSEFDSNWILFANATQDNTPLQAANIPFYTTNQIENDYITYGLNHSKKLSNGIIMSNELKFERNFDNSSPTSVEKSNSSIVLSFDIPLLAGKGDFASLQKKAAYKVLNAQINDYEYSVAKVVSDAILLYYKCIGTQESLDILKKSEQSMEQIKNDTQRLIKANEAPAAELKKVESGLANRISQRIMGETELFECFQNIGLITGKPFDEFENIEIENVEYPIPEDFEIQNIDLNDIIQKSMIIRKDIQAYKLRLEAAQNILKYAKDKMQNNVSLELKADVKGLSEYNNAHSFSKAWSENKSDTSYSATVKRVFSGNRNSDRNFYQKSLADYNKMQIAYSEIKRNAKSEITIMYKKLAGNWNRLQKIKQAIEFSEFSLDAEKKKLKLGMTTVLDVINVEDSYNSTYLNYIQTKVEFIHSIVEFARITGNLIEIKDNGKINIINLIFSKNIQE